MKPDKLDRPLFVPKPPLTLREAIAQGPKFERVEANALCRACGVLDDFDRSTGLCVCCWRVWRWSSRAERGGPETS